MTDAPERGRPIDIFHGFIVGKAGGLPEVSATRLWLEGHRAGCWARAKAIDAGGEAEIPGGIQIGSVVMLRNVRSRGRVIGRQGDMISVALDGPLPDVRMWHWRDLIELDSGDAK